MAKKEEIKKKVFDEVESKLLSFKSSPEYIEYLYKMIQEALDFAAEDEMVIYIDPSDESCIPALEKRFGFAPSVSRESWIGGMRAVIPAKNVFIDESFAERMKRARETCWL